MMSFEEQLERDLLWREEELVSLKRAAIASRSNEIALRAILRASWAMLYAHFEGFTKFSWELLLITVENQKTPVSGLRDDFRVLSLQKGLKKLTNGSTQDCLNYFENEMPALYESCATFHKDSRLSTKSNLWPDTYDGECAKIGIKSESLESNRNIIKVLVSRRNNIAHGEKMTISSIEDYSSYEKATLLVMHELAESVTDIIKNRRYMK